MQELNYLGFIRHWIADATLVVALQLRLGRHVFHLGPHEAFQPAQEAFDLPASFCLFISSIRSARKASRSCTTSDFSCSAMEIACHVFGQAGVCLGQDFSKLGIGVELLRLRAQAGAFGRVGGERYAAAKKK